MELFPYQVEGIEILSASDRFILADDMGLGKTAQLLKTVETVKNPSQPTMVIVVCPNSVKHTWKNQIDEWVSCPHKVLICGRDKNSSFPQWRKQCTDNIVYFVIVNYENLYDFITYYDEDLEQYKRKATTSLTFVIPWDICIFDEAHELRNHKTITTKSARFTSSISKRIYMSTGTPIVNYIQDLYGILMILFPREFKSYMQFTKDYCIVNKTEWGIKVEPNFNPQNYKIRELVDRLKHISLRRKKEDVIKDMPPLLINKMWMDLEEEQQAIYDEMEQFMLTKVEDEYIVAPLTIAQITRLKQIAVSPQLLVASKKFTGAKISAVKDIISGTENPVTIISQFKETAYRLSKQFGGVCVTGDMSVEDRQHSIQQFISGKTRLFFGTTMTCYQGIDGLQKVCDTMVCLDKVWAPSIHDQLYARLQRLGQTKPVTVNELLANDTVEEDIDALWREKRYLFDMLFNDVPPLEMMQELAKIMVRRRMKHVKK